jgi:hypothetical protein
VCRKQALRAAAKLDVEIDGVLPWRQRALGVADGGE